jgi:hypothetical protein
VQSNSRDAIGEGGGELIAKQTNVRFAPQADIPKPSSVAVVRDDSLLVQWVCFERLRQSLNESIGINRGWTHRVGSR